MKNHSVSTTIWVALAMLSNARAEEFAKGPGALEVFDAEGFAATPLAAKLWLLVLVAIFLIGLAFVRKHPIARWVVGGFIVVMATAHTVLLPSICRCSPARSRFGTLFVGRPDYFFC